MQKVVINVWAERCVFLERNLFGFRGAIAVSVNFVGFWELLSHRHHVPLGWMGLCLSQRSADVSQWSAADFSLCNEKKKFYDLSKTLSPVSVETFSVQKLFINTAIEYLRLFNSSSQGQRIFLFSSFFLF